MEAYAKLKAGTFEEVKALNPPLGFEYRPVIFEATSALCPAAATWWRKITNLAVKTRCDDQRAVDQPSARSLLRDSLDLRPQH